MNIIYVNILVLISLIATGYSEKITLKCGDERCESEFLKIIKS
jgi:hypothetical protein